MLIIYGTGLGKDSTCYKYATVSELVNLINRLTYLISGLYSSLCQGRYYGGGPVNWAWGPYAAHEKWYDTRSARLDCYPGVPHSPLFTSSSCPTQYKSYQLRFVYSAETEFKVEPNSAEFNGPQFYRTLVEFMTDPADANEWKRLKGWWNL